MKKLIQIVLLSAVAWLLVVILIRLRAWKVANQQQIITFLTLVILVKHMPPPEPRLAAPVTPSGPFVGK